MGYKKLKRYLTVVSAIVLTFIFISGVFAQDVRFEDYFDDPALPEWEHSESVRGEEGELLIEGDGFAFHGGVWSPTRVTVRFQWRGAGAVALHYQVSDQGGYMVHIGGEGVQFVFVEGAQTSDISHSPIEVPQNEWIELTVLVEERTHLVLFNGDPILDGIFPVEMPAGGLILRAEGETIGIFDFVELEGSGADSADEPSPDTSEQAEEPSTQLAISELEWIRLGGPPGGLGYDIRYNFDNPDTWYVTDANAGVHISYDNGLTWEQSNQGIDTFGGASGDGVPVFSLTIDPHNPDILWAGTDMSGRIYKSMDGGQTWESKDQGVIHEFEILLSFRGFTVDPRTSDVVYAMGELQKPGNNVWGLGVGGVVYKTTNGGDRWARIWHGPIPSSLARYMWIDPRDPDVLYVSTGIFDRGAVGEGDPTTDSDPFGGLGVLKSTDGGETWQILGKENGLDFLYIGSLYMHPEDPDVLFAAAGHVVNDLSWARYETEGHSPLGIYRTTDGGENWEQVLEPDSPILVQTFSAVDICPSDPQIIYAGSDVAVYRSKDGGNNWTQMSGGVSGWGPPGVRAGWPIDMQCDPRDPNRVFANNYSGGNFLSADGGQTWVNASTGYSGAQIIGVAVDPFDPAHIFAAGRSGVWHSYDGGISWLGVHNPGETQALAGGEWGGVAFDPREEGHILLGGQHGFLERVPEENRWFPVGPPHGYFPETSEIEFAPSNSQIVYAVSANHNTMVHADSYEVGFGVALSRDSGSSWTEIAGEQFDDVVLTDVSVDPTDEYVVYVASKLGLFKTTDAGETWQLLSRLSQTGPVRTVAVSPADPSKVFAGVPYQGLFVSEDGGATWRQLSAGLEPNSNYRDIIFDPTNPEVIYIADILSGVYRSEDGGESWARLSQGMTNRAATTLALSSDGLHLYAGTSGGGVFRLDLNGNPPDVIGDPFEPAEEAEVVEDIESDNDTTPENLTNAEENGEESKGGSISRGLLYLGGAVLFLVIVGFAILMARRKV